MTVLSLPKRDRSAPLKERVAEEIRVLAARHKGEGVNQTVLASVIGVSQSQMSKRLLGKTPFTLNELEAIARYFDVDAAELLGGSRNPHPDGPDGGMVRREGIEPPTRWFRGNDLASRGNDLAKVA